MDYLSFDDVKKLVVEHSGNDNPGIFIVDKITGNPIEKFTVHIDDDGDIIFEV